MLNPDKEQLTVLDSDIDGYCNKLTWDIQLSAILSGFLKALL